MPKPQIHYRRKLPHIHPPGETLFVTFRLANSLPKELVLRWLEEQKQMEAKASKKVAPEFVPEELQNQRKKFFARFDSALDKALSGPDWLKQPEVAQSVMDALDCSHNSAFHILAYCIMPNHVHLVIQILANEPPFQMYMKQLKGSTARKINQLLNRQGPFWQREYFDYVVRNGDELKRIISYVLENPVKAGLCENWNQWPFSFCREE